MISRSGLIHFMFHPVSAKRFAEPLVAAARESGIDAELWIEDLPGLDAFRENIKVPVRICPSNLDFNPVKALKTFFTLVARLNERKPLAVQAHLFRAAFLPLLAARITGVPIRIYHNHGVSYLGYRGIMRILLKAIEAANGRLATHVITVNEELRPALQAVMPKRREIKVFGPGSVCGLAPEEYATSFEPESKIYARSNLGLGPNDLVMLYVGRPHRHKGFFILLQAFAAAFAGRSDVHLLICGCTSSDVAAALPQVPRNIRALGYHQDLHPIYWAADILVLPSLYEGLPYSLLEAAAQGCALLASKIPGTGVLVEEGKNGFLVEPGNIEDLVQALRHIDQNRGRLAAMGAASYEKAQKFRREKVIGPYLQFLRETLPNQ